MVAAVAEGLLHCWAVHAQSEVDDDALSWASVEAAFLAAWKDLPDTRNRDLEPAAALEEVCVSSLSELLDLWVPVRPLLRCLSALQILAHTLC